MEDESKFSSSQNKTKSRNISNTKGPEKADKNKTPNNVSKNETPNEIINNQNSKEQLPWEGRCFMKNENGLNSSLNNYFANWGQRVSRTLLNSGLTRILHLRF